MKEYYDGPAIDDFEVQTGGVILPDEAYVTPQIRLCDLQPGEWGIPRAGSSSILRDTRTSITVLNTEDAQSPYVSRQLMWVQPVIKVTGNPGQAKQYMVDARRMDHFKFSRYDFGLELGEDSEGFQHFQKQFGSQVVRMLIVRKFNDVVAWGEESLQATASQFAQEIDDFESLHFEALQKGERVDVPSFRLSRHDIRFHVNLETELSIIKNNQENVQ